MAKKSILTFDDYVNKNFGNEILLTADKFIDKHREILNTTLSLDIALSGGIPEGKVVLLSGRTKVGKTTLCLTLAANAQKEGRSVFYFDVERRCDPSLLDTIDGLDKTKLTLVRSSCDNLLSAQSWLEILHRAILDNPRSLIIIDSLAALSTLIEQSEDVGSTKDMAGVPELLASFFRKTISAIDNNNCILICLSQLQSNRNPMGPKYSEKGGMAVQYACSVWISFDWVKKWKVESTAIAPAGHDIQATVKCSALGPPHLPAEIPLRYGYGIDKSRDVFIQSENLGFIEKSGAWYKILDFEDTKLHGADAVIKFLNENPDKRDFLENKIRKLMIPCKEDNK